MFHQANRLDFALHDFLRPDFAARPRRRDELRALFRKHKVEFDERYVWD